MDIDDAPAEIAGACTLVTKELTRNAFDLWIILGENMSRAADIYVTDEAGEVFTRAALERRRLSDGSFVYNLVLTRSA